MTLDSLSDAGSTAGLHIESDSMEELHVNLIRSMKTASQYVCLCKTVIIYLVMDAICFTDF